MPIETPLTGLLGIRHPILLAPMDVIAGARLVGGGERAPAVLAFWAAAMANEAGSRPETAKLKQYSAPVRHRLHHLEPRQAA